MLLTKCLSRKLLLEMLLCKIQAGEGFTQAISLGSVKHMTDAIRQSDH